VEKILSSDDMTRNVSLITAVSIVITNMIGTGILTTPGVLSSYLTGPGQVMLVWILGGIIALLGAVVYGQMGSIMPHSGGEYNYLSRIYHPFLGIASGWVSVIAGFAGPIALSAMAFAAYLMNFTFMHQILNNSFSTLPAEKTIALLLIFLLTVFHVFRKQTALTFQIVITALLIAFLLLISFWGIKYSSGIFPEGISPSSTGRYNFGMALLLSIYSYTGWNASCYFAGEIRNPKRNLPLSLFLGVAIVMILYFTVNYGLMNILGVQNLSGKIDFLSDLGTKLNGRAGNQIISITVLAILLASISSMIFTGSRIPLLGKRSLNKDPEKTEKKGIFKMFILQNVIVCVLIIFTSFRQLFITLTIVLSIFSILTAFGIFLLPWKRFKVGKIHEITVKFSAAVLILILTWLIINSIGLSLNNVFRISGIAIASLAAILLFRLFRIRNWGRDTKIFELKLSGNKSITKIN
jgi:APA family basic amino acid/polyamine antiporter